MKLHSHSLAFSVCLTSSLALANGDGKHSGAKHLLHQF